VGGGTFGEPGLVGLEFIHGDIAGVRAGNEGDPFLAGLDLADVGAVAVGAVAVPAEAEHAGVAGVVQDPEHG
jgi:hypothetical protein